MGQIRPGRLKIKGVPGDLRGADFYHESHEMQESERKSG